MAAVRVPAELPDAVGDPVAQLQWLLGEPVDPAGSFAQADQVVLA